MTVASQSLRITRLLDKDIILSDLDEILEKSTIQ